jgi:hypothetical protein
MQTCWYIVIEALDAWWVDCEGKAFGPFESEVEARMSAPRIALTYGDETRQSEVWVTERDGRRNRIWVGPPPVAQGT